MHLSICLPTIRFVLHKTSCLFDKKYFESGNVWSSCAIYFIPCHQEWQIHYNLGSWKGDIVACSYFQPSQEDLKMRNHMLQAAGVTENEYYWQNIKQTLGWKLIDDNVNLTIIKFPSGKTPSKLWAEY